MLLLVLITPSSLRDRGAIDDSICAAIELLAEDELAGSIREVLIADYSASTSERYRHKVQEAFLSCKIEILSVDKTLRETSDIGALCALLCHVRGLDQCILYETESLERQLLTQRQVHTQFSVVLSSLQGLDQAGSCFDVKECKRLLSELCESLGDSSFFITARLRELTKSTAAILETVSDLFDGTRPKNTEWHVVKRQSFSLAWPISSIQLSRAKAQLKLLESAPELVNFFGSLIRFFELAKLLEGQRNNDESERSRIQAISVWLCVYCFLSAKWSLNGHNRSETLLLFFRSIEFYLLSHLAGSPNMSIESGRFFYNERELTGFRSLFAEINQQLPFSFPDELIDATKSFNRHRNQNLLTHGTNLPSHDQLTTALGLAEEFLTERHVPRHLRRLPAKLAVFTHPLDNKMYYGKVLASGTLLNLLMEQ
jgi:hypothetical protein